MNVNKFILLAILLLSLSCGNETYRLENGTSFVTTEGTHKITKLKNGVRNDYTSSSAGNLMATAMREVHDLDIALYPRDLVNEENVAFVSTSMSGQDMESLMNLYPLSGNKDEFMVGVMKGRDIKKLIRTRIQDTFKLDIEVAGMVYNVHMVAGVVTMDNYGLDNGRTFEDTESYRIAINNHFFFSGETFPSYKFRNGLNFSFVPTGSIISAKETLRTYLRTVGELPYLSEVRGRFSDFTFNDIGFKRTYEIQGNAHRSPVWGHKVTTGGIVTAVDNVDWFPRGIDIIIQDETGDGVDETSDALHVHLKTDITDVKVGDYIRVKGTVFEHMTLDNKQNMSKTVIRDVTDLKIFSTNNPLPKPVLIGMDGRPVPNRVLSTWVGDLNFKPFLKLTDGIDFWESLEGMRVSIRNPRVTGFRGGNEELVRLNPQRHLSLFIVPDGFRRTTSRTLTGGITEDFMVGDFNPEVLHVSAGNLTADFNRLSPSNPRKLENCNLQGGLIYTDDAGEQKCRVPSGLITTEYHYNVGDIFKGDITGIISFESNLFGGGEYTLVLPDTIYRYDKFVNNSKEAPCVVRSLEYLTPAYTELFDQGLQNATCAEILQMRESLSDSPEGPKFAIASKNLLKDSFEKDDDGNPKKTINCLDVNFFKGSMPFECRPQTKQIGEGRRLTIAAANLENLAGNQEDRLESMGKAIRHNLKCPDIVTLVEVQDDNGLDLQGEADATETINKIIKNSKCAQDGVKYQGINVNPINHNEGGQPGGNIRVAMIYNAKRVNFTSWGGPTDGPLANGTLQETRMTQDGNLSVNPGRVFPNADAFKNTRKSIVAQFDFKGEKIFVIGNHFNSKLGDTSFWGAQQPPYPKSDEQRALLAQGINEFVRIIELREPNANIIVLGDFNAHYNERSMKTLENGGILNNMMFSGNLVDPRDRYSHNFNGNSSAIDFIFANRKLMTKNPAFEVLHLNTDYMGRISDHDPVLASFYFKNPSPSDELREQTVLPLSELKGSLKIKIIEQDKFSILSKSKGNIIVDGLIQNSLFTGPETFKKLKEKPHCEVEGSFLETDKSLVLMSSEEQALQNRLAIKLSLVTNSGNELHIKCNKMVDSQGSFSWSEVQGIFGGVLEATVQ
ncbi:MAG: 5'-nucleotidase C-terminal domain-containing protein [Bacteriovoracaceae bacterium]|nr:5'-nucleotidase C-terminal domain-containing protein [Bacteriovoracaceae bacterium]